MSFLSQLVELGTHGYDNRTARRLRLLNGIAIVGIAVCAACLVVVFLLLLLTGQNPFTAGNAILITFIAIYLPTRNAKYRWPAMNNVKNVVQPAKFQLS